MLHAFQKAFIDRPRLAFQHTAMGVDAGLGQAMQATAGHFRVGVLHGRDHPCHTGIHQGVGAGRRTPVMAAGFEGHIGGGATGQFTGRAQGMHLGMGLAGPHVPALAHHLAVAHDDAADTRVGMGGVATLARQFQSTGHVVGVEDRLLGRLAHCLAGSRARRSISSRNSLRSWKRR